MSNKKKRSCGLVILAIGVVPDTRLARDAGIKVDRGILVDNRLMTNLEGIYAAGDVAQAEELLSGEKRTIPIWPNAFRQGFFAGCNMAGGQAEYEGGLAMNAVEVCGLATVSVGISNPGSGGYEELSDHNPQTGAYKKLVLQGNRLVGMVFVGDIERAGIYTGLIKAKVNVGSLKEKLLGQDFGLLTLPETYRAQVQEGKGLIT